MENNQMLGQAAPAIVGAIAWGASRLIRYSIVKGIPSRILNNLDMLQMGGGTGNEYRDFVITTKLLNIVVPAIIGIASGVGAVLAEINGDHALTLGLAAFAIPHLIEPFTNKKVIKEE